MKELLIVFLVFLSPMVLAVSYVDQPQIPGQLEELPQVSELMELMGTRYAEAYSYASLDLKELISGTEYERDCDRIQGFIDGDYSGAGAFLGLTLELLDRADYEGVLGLLMASLERFVWLGGDYGAFFFYSLGSTFDNLEDPMAGYWAYCAALQMESESPLVTSRILYGMACSLSVMGADSEYIEALVEQAFYFNSRLALEVLLFHTDYLKEGSKVTALAREYVEKGKLRYYGAPEWGCPIEELRRDDIVLEETNGSNGEVALLYGELSLLDRKGFTCYMTIDGGLTLISKTLEASADDNDLYRLFMSVSQFLSASYGEPSVKDAVWPSPEDLELHENDNERYSEFILQGIFEPIAMWNLDDETTVLVLPSCNVNRLGVENGVTIVYCDSSKKESLSLLN